jgi:hypothetical protein
LFSTVDRYPISKAGGSEITVSIQGTNTTG